MSPITSLLPIESLIHQVIGPDHPYSTLIFDLLPVEHFMFGRGFLFQDYVAAMNIEFARRGLATVTDWNDDAGWEKARDAGFILKIWLATQDERTRKQHQWRHKEERPIGERFSIMWGEIGPMYPRDNAVMPADKFNCRCKLAFTMQ